MKKKTLELKTAFFVFFIACLTELNGQDFAPVAETSPEALTVAITVDLKNPTYNEGVLSTESGGVITAEGFRLQARQINYTRVKDSIEKVYATNDLILEIGDYLFVGESLEYDFKSRTGVIRNGRTALSPWFFGGKTIEIQADGTYLITNAFITTSENINSDWSFIAESAVITPDRNITTKKISLKVGQKSFVSLPRLKANLDWIYDLPLKGYIRWGGRQGSRFGAAYELFTWKNLKSFLRLDYRLKRGFGGGVELYYKSDDKRESFESINYIAADSSITDPSERTRYRFQGIYNRLIHNDSISLSITYDKLSDQDMATDYNDRGLELDTAGRTQLLARKQDLFAITTFLTRVRVNNFQTLKQELPTLQTTPLPFSLDRVGVISESNYKGSYLDFTYSNDIIDVRDYNSTRFEASERLYRPFKFQGLNIIPEIGGRAIYYGNSPSKNPKWASSAFFGIEANTRLSKFYGKMKHVIEPYIKYQYWTYPTTAPNQHYVFDVDDGLFRLNELKLGVNQSFYRKRADGSIHRLMTTELFAPLFFDSPTFEAILPKLYFKSTYQLLPNLRHVSSIGWNFRENELDHFNFRTEWTLNANFAIACEYRHRDAYSWRKVDPYNFMLDSYRTIKALRHSSLSDRRDTLLGHCFFRFHPSWALEFEARTGWNRQKEPSYTEFEVDLLGTLRSAWNIKIGFQHKEYDGKDNRVTIALSLGIPRPTRPSSAPPSLFE